MPETPKIVQTVVDELQSLQFALGAAASEGYVMMIYVIPPDVEDEAPQIGIQLSNADGSAGYYAGMEAPAAV